MSGSKLATHLGMSRQRFSERMNGRSKFTLDEVSVMSAALGVAPAVWFDEPENALNHLAAAPQAGLRGEPRNTP
jgi:plasmid maintenance system antidote protein VapI